MLSALHVQNLVVVREVELEFGPGLSVITGETGAGKSILIDALGLALGERAESRLIRPGAERAEVSASFSLDDAPAARAMLAAHDLDDGEECILRRVLNRDGRSRAYCNQAPVPLATLRELAATLVDIHAQHAGQRLLKREHQRHLLDDFGTAAAAAAGVAAACTTWQQARDALDEFNRGGADAARIDLMRYQVEELSDARLDAHELETIEENYRRLANAEAHLEHCQAVRDAITAMEGGAQPALDGALSHARALSKQSPDAENLLAALEQAGIAVGEALTELELVERGLDQQPGELERLDRRLAELHNLARKHHVELPELMALAARLEQELNACDQRDERAASLTAALQNAHEHYLSAAATLTKARRAAAKKLAKNVTARLHELGMPHATFSVQLDPASDTTPQPHGLDRIEFRVSTNPELDAGALAKVASGGELSRITLAIQAATAEHSGVPVTVYDEVDTGIGGNTANIVGASLRDVARHAQVICITHSPQVASAGDQHIFVDKQISDGQAATTLRTLDTSAREQEIARMLGAAKKSRSSIAHARELLAGARG